MTTVHRLLDEAFAGIEPTLEVQDLKEEIRANLEARAAELQAGGTSPDAAARRAFDELGDVRELVAEAADDVPDGGASQALRHKVRPRPAYVVSVVIASVAISVLVTLAALGLADILAVGAAPIVAWLAGAAVGVGSVVWATLLQETTMNHPMPPGRALGYGGASALAAFGLFLTGVVALGELAVWTYAFAGLALVAGIALFTGLVATQTNRKKAWVRQVGQMHAMDNRFEQDPAAAARFGVYTLVIWLTAFVVFAVLGLTVGWAWSWLVFVAAFAVMMLVIARMLFTPKDEQRK